VIHDICTVAFRRGGARILLAAAQVQGIGSAESVRRALRALQRVDDVDVIIVGRGGGSQDDLLAFNDELLVRDVASCRVPVVSAVGHEVDITLVDFAADARAATPSQAAEMVVPDGAARARLLDERSHRLRRAMHARIAEDRAHFERVARSLRDPRWLLASAQQLLDDRTARMARASSRRIARDQAVLGELARRLGSAHPRERIARDEARVAELRARIVDGTRRRLAGAEASSAELAGRLDAMSPLKVLGRGYAIATRCDDGRAVRDAVEVAVGDRVVVRVARGAFEASVVPSPTSAGRNEP
jgi:exodeoxyribonuclease VII large subunit